MTRDLMTPVERVVRPVRARQSVKLRMRRELLAHLQSSYDEERARGLDPADALARAARRLGDPAALTRQLQQSVPLLDRLFFTPLPAPGAYRRWESRAGHRLGLNQPFVSHAVALFLATAMLPYIASLFIAWTVDRSVYLRALTDRPLATILFNLAGITLMLILWSATHRFLITLAAPAGAAEDHRAARLARYALTLLADYFALTLICVTGMGRRTVTPADLAHTLVVTLALLLALTLTARGLAAHRRPYDPWLTLDLAA